MKSIATKLFVAQGVAGFGAIIILRLLLLSGVDPQKILLVGLVELILILIWSYTIFRRGLVQRLDGLLDTFHEIEQGHLDKRAAMDKFLGANDELTRLARQINRTADILEWKLRLEEALVHSSLFLAKLTREELAEGLNHSLKLLGQLLEVDRCYVFEFAENGRIMNNTYEWCTDGIAPQIENLQAIPSDAVPWWIGFLSKGEAVNIPCVSELPAEAAIEKTILEAQEIKSVLVVPMMSEEGLYGYIGFDSVRAVRRWSEDDVRLLNIFAGLVTTTLIRIKNQYELETQREFAKQVMENTEQGLTVTNQKNQFEYVNPAYARMLKLPVEQVIGKTSMDFAHPRDREESDRQRRKRQTGLLSSYRNRLIAADGSIIHVLISSSPRVANDRVVGSIASVTDITREVEIQRKLGQSETRHRMFLGAVPDWIIMLDRSGKVLDFSRGGNSLFQLSSRLVKEASISDALPSELSRVIEDGIETALELSTPRIYTADCTSQNGTLNLEIRMLASGPDEVLVVIHDISKYVRFEQMKSDFINRASHELRTPLATILLMVDLLEGEDHKLSKSMEYWKILKNELNRERNTLDDLLSVGRLESGKFQVEKHPLDPLPVLDSIVESIKPQAEISKIVIQVATQAVPKVNASANALDQIFRNLISNAVKFSHPKGTVRVSVYPERNGVSIEVQDQGIGIPPEDLPNIASRFHRAVNANKQEIPGSGVGLYIVKSITEELGGTLSITSELDHGTKVTVWLPAFSERGGEFAMATVDDNSP